MILPFIMMTIFAIGMLVTVYKDVTTMTIPNWVSLFVFSGFLVMVPFVWQGWDNFAVHVMAGGLMFVIGFAMFAFGWLGGGDAKLMAATSFWWVWSDLLIYVFYTTLAGGVLALFILFGRQFVPAKVITAPWMYRMIKDESKMPYGLALAFGAFMTLPNSEIFKLAAGSL